MNVSSNDTCSKPTKSTIRQSRATKRKANEQMESHTTTLPIDIPAKINQFHHYPADDNGPSVTTITTSPRKRAPKKQINTPVNETPEPVIISQPVDEMKKEHHDDVSCPEKKQRGRKQICQSCNQQVKEKKGPSVAQLANQERFKQKVQEAKKYQQAHPDITYRQAMALVGKN